MIESRLREQHLVALLARRSLEEGTAVLGRHGEVALLCHASGVVDTVRVDGFVREKCNLSSLSSGRESLPAGSPWRRRTNLVGFIVVQKALFLDLQAHDHRLSTATCIGHPDLSGGALAAIQHHGLILIVIFI